MPQALKHPSVYLLNAWHGKSAIAAVLKMTISGQVRRAGPSPVAALWSFFKLQTGFPSMLANRLHNDLFGNSWRHRQGGWAQDRPRRGGRGKPRCSTARGIAAAKNLSRRLEFVGMA